MLFKEISRDEYLKVRNTKGAKWTNRAKFIQKFIDSNIPFAEVDWVGEYVSAATCSTSLREGARLMKVDHIKVFSRNSNKGNEGKVYIVNEIMAKKLDA